MAAVISLIKAFDWRPKDLGELSWGQIGAINEGLGELDEDGEGQPSVSKDTGTPHTEFEELSRSVAYQNQMAQLILASKKSDGTLDMTKLLTLLKPPGAGKQT